MPKLIIHFILLMGLLFEKMVAVYLGLLIIEDLHIQMQ